MTDESTQRPPARGSSSSAMRTAECKDCRREVEQGRRDPEMVSFVYNEAAAAKSEDKGQSRSDRCSEHRQSHRKNIQGMAVAYIDLDTVGYAVDYDETGPTGPFGGLGPMPAKHGLIEGTADLGDFGFGMDESHIRDMLDFLENPEQRVLVVKAGTGTGKSTYMPYRLLDPPAGCFRLADLGPIIVTEPRVQATMGVAGFVGEQLSGAGGVGPGYPVGYQVSGDKNHDASCELIFVTDGTVINWMKEGRLSQIGTIIVDEAHERSTNIDFIMGFLKQNLDRYPHLRVIVTSATFNADFYVEYFRERAGELQTTSQGLPTVNKVVVEAQKSIGYGFPLFPNLDVLSSVDASNDKVEESWKKACPELKLAETLSAGDFITEHWKTALAPAFKAEDLTADLQGEVGTSENLHATTEKLLLLRYQGPIIDPRQWKPEMPSLVGNFTVDLVKGLDREDIFGDVLAFLPTTNTIEIAVDIIRAALGDSADVYALVSNLSTAEKEAALDARLKGSKRKVVVATNLAETSLTVEGVRFVVDSGLICQSEWDPETASGSLPSVPHSQSGIKQRWGRVGRKAPGWVFPLYSKGQYAELPEDTRPGSTRSNLESLVMTAKMGGVDDVIDFPWPAAFEPKTVELDNTAIDAREGFAKEISRADVALQESGATDIDGDPTSFGKELTRFQGLGSTSGAIAIMYADRLACVPEVVTILALLDGKWLVGRTGLLLRDDSWPAEWRIEAADRHQAIFELCEDDADAVLQIVAAWERSDPSVPPWEDSELRREFARGLWINGELLMEMAEKRREVLEALSPAMKEEVKRFVEPGLLKRARGVLSRSMGAARYSTDVEGKYRPSSGEAPDVEGVVGSNSLLPNPGGDVISLSRRLGRGKGIHEITNLVNFEPWAERQQESETTGAEDAMDLLVAAKEHARADPASSSLGLMLLAWPPGTRVQLEFRNSVNPQAGAKVLDLIPPAPAPKAEPEDDDETAADETGSTEDLDEGAEDTSWPRPNDPVVDNEDVERRLVVDTRPLEDDALGCGDCARCDAGESSACETQIASNGSELDEVDVLEAWSQRATLVADLSDPPFVLESSGIVDAGWFEVVGYSAFPVAGAEIRSVRIIADWRAPGVPDAPGEHHDLSPGDPVEVRVGELRKDGRSDVRLLYRTDGLGRFALGEADTRPDKQEEFRQVAASLNRRQQGLVGKLQPGAVVVGTALPRKEEGCYSFSLMESLYQHVIWSCQKLDQRSSSSVRAPAEVVEVPNSNGYATVRLAVVDSTAGIEHEVSALVGNDETVPPEVGAKVWVELRRDRVRLPLRGVNLEAVKHLIGGIGQDVEFKGSTDAISTVEVGTVDDALLSRRPVSAALCRSLELLAPETDSAGWIEEVWLFFARSHHLVAGRNGLKTRTTHEYLDEPVSLEVAVAAMEDQLAVFSIGEPVMGFVVAETQNAGLVVNLTPTVSVVVNEPTKRGRVHSIGDEVVGVITDVRPRWGRVQLELSGAFEAQAAIPPEVEAALAKQRAGLAKELGVDISITRNPSRVAVRATTKRSLDAALMEVEAFLNGAAALVDIPESKKGLVLGKGAARLHSFQDRIGILHCNFLDAPDGFKLLVLGRTVEVLVEFLNDLDSMVHPNVDAAAHMTVPDGKNGLLIGKGGATVKQLLAKSGCKSAFAVDNGPRWLVKGPTELMISRFVELANEIVPGCRLED